MKNHVPPGLVDGFGLAPVFRGLKNVLLTKKGMARGGHVSELLRLTGKDFEGVVGCGMHGCAIKANVPQFNDDSKVVLHKLLEGDISLSEVHGRDLRDKMNTWDEALGFKHVRTREKFAFHSARKDFMSEVNSVKQLVDALGYRFVQEETLIPLGKTDPSGQGDIIGIEIHNSRVNDYTGVNYLVPQTLCSATILKARANLDIEKLLRDVLTTVDKLQNFGFVHSDIKGDNIVVCGDRCVIIDWGELHRCDYLETPVASKLTNNPLATAIETGTGTIMKAVYKNDRVRRFLEVHRGVRPRGLDNETYIQWFNWMRAIYIQQAERIAGTLKPKEALNKYWKKLDLFSVGIALLQLITDQDMSQIDLRVMSWIQNLMFFDDGWGSAREALQELDKETRPDPPEPRGGGAGAASGMALALLTLAVAASALILN